MSKATKSQHQEVTVDDIATLRRLEDLPCMAPALAARLNLSEQIDGVQAKIDAHKKNISINRQALRNDDGGPARAALEAEIQKLHEAEGQHAALRKEATLSQLDVEEAREAARAEVLPALHAMAAEDLDALIRTLGHVQVIERILGVRGHWGDVKGGVKRFYEYLSAARNMLDSEDK